MITFELAKQLKEAGYPNMHFACSKDHDCNCDKSDCELDAIYHPSLSQLIEECGEEFHSLDSPVIANKIKDFGIWTATGSIDRKGKRFGFVNGKTPSEAVARLWLKLNKK